MAAQMQAESVTVNEGDRVRARRERLGMDKKRLAAAAGISRETLAAVESGSTARQATMAALDRALSEVETEVGITAPIPEPIRQGEQLAPGVVRFKVEGVYGAKALIVEVPPENIAELEMAIDRIMRRLQQGNEGPEGTADSRP